MIHFNELKANIRSLYETFKKVMDYEPAINTAIETVIQHFSPQDIILQGKIFTKMNDVKEFILKELEEEVNVIVEDGLHYSLTDTDGHIDWYRSKKANGEISFRFWNRYKKYLTHIKGWAESSVDKIDIITDEILEDIEDPNILNRPFDRRGLVVGYVQSGKTANFMGLINKSIDSGYRIIIILAGLHENLRQQTQERIDEEVIGRDTDKNAKQKPFGVTTLPGESYIPIDYFTESNNDPRPNKNGDFNIKASHGTPPTSDRPIIFVVKKNKSVLKNLIKYFSDWIDSFGEELTFKQGNIKQFNNLPLLMIDDESDQASVNTKAERDKSGEEIDPTAINKCIRQILNLFRQKVYVGYTATPFANIFIRHDVDNKLGYDLFPSAFIKTLGTPSNYLGPKEVFGLKNDTESEMPIYREVRDAGQPNDNPESDSEFMPLKHKSDYLPTFLPESLKHAIYSFILSSAIRWYRGHENKHNTMLIHCTRYNITQLELSTLINDEITVIRNAILSNNNLIIEKFKQIFYKDFIPTSSQMGKDLPKWDEVKPLLNKAIIKLEPKCRVINGTVGDILDYKNKSQNGLWSIVIGGDKLSRGLTLDGLTISYFTRSTSLYDTLMQMGRWFGYRSGFEDLCRIYTTSELFSWYRHIATAFESLRAEFIEMTRLKLTPKDFGLRVEDHPDMMVTNVMKMRATESMLLNYQGTLTETTTLPSDKNILKSNFLATEEFIKSLGEKSNKNLFQKNVWEKVPVDRIQEFLKNYKTYKGMPAANSIRINQYIDLQKINNIKEFLNWNVVLVSLQKKQNLEYFNFAGNEIVLPERKITEQKIDRYFIQRMHDPNFEFSDYTQEQKKRIDDEKITNKEARKINPRKNTPLLMIYILSLKEKKDFQHQPVGFAISWPSSDVAKPINYVINTVYQELEMNEND